jgi:Ser/Thr protein kinase RdoA (MazF antagonist)
VNQAELSLIADRFGLSILSVVRQPGRTRAAVFRARTPQEDFAIKVYPAEYDEGDLRSEFALSTLLRARGVAVPRYLRATPSEVFFRFGDGSGALVYEWVDGAVPDRLDRGLIEKGSALLASFHQAVADTEIDRNDSWLWEDARRHTSARRLPDGLAEWIEERVRGGRPWPRSVPMITCHNDFVPGNLVVSPGGRLAAIDLTNAIPAPPEWDLAVYCAGLTLANQAVDLDLRATCSSAVKGYLNAGGHVDIACLEALLETALAQRAVFLTERVSARREAKLWERLSATVGSLGIIFRGEFA